MEVQVGHARGDLHPSSLSSFWLYVNRMWICISTKHLHEEGVDSFRPCYLAHTGALAESERLGRDTSVRGYHDGTDSKTLSIGVHSIIVADHEDKRSLCSILLAPRSHLVEYIPWWKIRRLDWAPLPLLPPSLPLLSPPSPLPLPPPPPPRPCCFRWLRRLLQLAVDGLVQAPQCGYHTCASSQDYCRRTSELEPTRAASPPAP